MGSCYTKIKKKKPKNLHNTAIVNLKQVNCNESPNTNLPGSNDSKNIGPAEFSIKHCDILTEKKIIRKQLDEKYKKIPNFINENEKNVLRNKDLYGAVGLYNLGNTCFMNAAIQLLSNTQPLVDYFLSGLHLKELVDSNPFGSKGVVVYHFGLLLKDIWLTREQAIEPQDFYDIIKKYSPRFSEGNQEDIQEFLAYLLDIIHEDLNRIYKTFELKTKNEEADTKIEIGRIELINDPSLELSNIEVLAAKEWQNYLSKNRSIIVDLFQGQLKNTIVCLNCLNVSHRFEPIMYISVPIPHLDEENDNRYDIDLIECLKEFTKEEKLDPSETFNCDNCNEKSQCKKKIDIWKAPNILIIHFKRFRYTKKQKKKIDTFIDFPIQNLDLSPFQAVHGNEKPIYDLFAVANHEGTLNKGHYFSYAKNDEDKNWYEYDDEIVKLIKKPQKRIVTANAYLLFYAKSTSDYFFRQTLTAPELWPHLVKIQEALQTNRKNEGKIRSSTGIRESLRSQVNNSQKNSEDFKKIIAKSNENNVLFVESNSKDHLTKQRNENLKKSQTIDNQNINKYIKRNSETNFTNLINNYTENNLENVGSQRSLNMDFCELDGHLKKFDNLYKKHNLEIKKSNLISVIEEEKVETAILQGRENIEIIKNNKNKGFEIIKDG